jgi:hypothetical protein
MPDDSKSQAADRIRIPAHKLNKSEKALNTKKVPK